MRKLQVQRSYLGNDIVRFGTSQTSLESCASLGVPAYLNAGALLAMYLRQAGANVKCRVFGRGGDTTAHFLGRANTLRLYGTPKLGIIEGGVNDAIIGTTSGTATAGTSTTITLPAFSAASTAISALLNSFMGCTITITAGQGSGQTNTIIAYSTSRVATVKTAWATPPNNTSVFSIAPPGLTGIQRNLQAMVKILKYAVSGDGRSDMVHVWSQTQLPVGETGQRYLVMEDTSINGGAVKNNSSQHDNISFNYSGSPKQTVWEYRNALAGEAGWGRVAIAGMDAFDEGTKMVILLTNNYLNWSSGGDNYNTITGAGTQYAPYVPVHDAVFGAATAENVVACDLYDYESRLIYGPNPQMTQGSFANHYIDLDQHKSRFGHENDARALYATTIAQPGWLAALSS